VWAAGGGGGTQQWSLYVPSGCPVPGIGSDPGRYVVSVREWLKVEMEFSHKGPLELLWLGRPPYQWLRGALALPKYPFMHPG
jgi:hypothetical protein